MSLTPYELQLNRIAQDLISVADGVAWFQGLGSDEKRSVLRVLQHITNQAHPLKSEVEPAITQAGLKPTFTPCVIVLKAETPEKGFAKLPTLPQDEWVKSFRLLMALFTLADRRRRESVCRNGCSHEWHNLAKYAH